jgi:hypothetical protein
MAANIDTISVLIALIKELGPLALVTTSLCMLIIRHKELEGSRFYAVLFCLLGISCGLFYRDIVVVPPILPQALKSIDPVVLALSSSVTVNSNRKVRWDYDRILNPSHFTLSADKTTITIVESGTYRLDVKLHHPERGVGMYPRIEINGQNVMHFYGSKHDTYGDVVMNYVFLANKNTHVVIGFQNDGSIQIGSHVYNYLCLTKL